MESIYVRIFTTLFYPAEEMVTQWKNNILPDPNVKLEISIIDVEECPEEAERYDVLFTPTVLIALPTGREFRFVGKDHLKYDFIDRLSIYIRITSNKMKTIDMQKQAQQMTMNAQEQSQNAVEMLNKPTNQSPNPNFPENSP